MSKNESMIAESVTAGRPAIDSKIYERQVKAWLEIDKWRPEEVTATKLQKAVGGQYSRAKAFLEHFMAGYDTKSVSDIPEPPAQFLEALTKAGYDLHGILFEEQAKGYAENELMFEEMRKKLLAGKSEVEERLNEVLNEKADLQEELNRLKIQFNSQEEKLNGLQETHTQLDKDMAVIKTEKEGIEEQLKTSISLSESYHKEIIELKGKVGDQDKIINDRHEMIVGLEESLTASEKKSVEMKSLQEKHTTLERQHKALEQKLETARGNNETLTGAVSELKEERQGNSEKLELLAEQVETLTKERDSGRQRVGDLEKKVIDLMAINIRPKTSRKKAVPKK